MNPKHSLKGKLRNRIKGNHTNGFDATIVSVMEESKTDSSRLFVSSMAACQAFLAAFDFACLLFGLLVFLHLIRTLHLSAELPDGLTLVVNTVISLGLTISCRYYNLRESRYSLGKALLIGSAMLIANMLLVFPYSTGHFLPICVLLAVGTGTGSLLSGWMHHELSRPFHLNMPFAFYCNVEKCIKRIFDFTSALFGLLLISPLMLLVFVLIQLESPGFAIFSQVRIGGRERPFRMYKFRSMRINSSPVLSESKATLYKKLDDPRITRIGYIIRKLSIDELPQLWNVLRGEMSLVGPRPPLPDEFATMNWRHRRKFEAIPGMTGLWQITGRAKNQRDFNSVAAYDTDYVENWSLLEDLKILLKTIPVVLSQKGAC